MPSILPIYHLKNVKYTDKFNVINEIRGSQGLTLNGNIYLDYKIKSKNIIQINMGMPFIVRDARPDGLTRHFIANLENIIKSFLMTFLGLNFNCANRMNQVFFSCISILENYITVNKNNH
jgi:hypothetical protein